MCDLKNIHDIFSSRPRDFELLTTDDLSLFLSDLIMLACRIRSDGRRTVTSNVRQSSTPQSSIRSPINATPCTVSNGSSCGRRLQIRGDCGNYDP